MGAFGETRLLQPQSDGSYKYSGKIVGFNSYISTTLQLADGGVLAAVGDGRTRLLQPRFVRRAQDVHDGAEEILK